MVLNDNVILSAVSISRSYLGRKVIGPCTFHVNRGEILAIVGQSGIGKTTLLKVLAGIEQPDSGNVTINGAPISTASKQISMVFQDYALFPWRTAIENVEYPLLIQGISKKDRRERAEIALRDVRLSEFTKLYPSQLSGGMKQRVAVARALVSMPAVMLLDEPLSSLDHDTRRQIQVLLKNLIRELGCAVALVTHDIEEATHFADRILVLSGTPSTIVAELKNEALNTDSQIGYLRRLIASGTNDDLHSTQHISF